MHWVHHHRCRPYLSGTRCRCGCRYCRRVQSVSEWKHEQEIAWLRRAYPLHAIIIECFVSHVGPYIAAAAASPSEESIHPLIRTDTRCSHVVFTISQTQFVSSSSTFSPSSDAAYIFFAIFFARSYSVASLPVLPRPRHFLGLFVGRQAHALQCYFFQRYYSTLVTNNNI